MRVSFRMFRATFGSWESLFEEAAAFASSLSPEQLINISHSEDGNDGIVTVWYREDLPPANYPPR